MLWSAVKAPLHRIRQLSLADRLEYGGDPECVDPAILGSLRVPGEVQYPNAWVPDQHGFDELYSRDPGKLRIGHDQVEVRRGCGGQKVECNASVGGLHDIIAAVPEHPSDNQSDCVIVVDHQQVGMGRVRHASNRLTTTGANREPAHSRVSTTAVQRVRPFYTAPSRLLSSREGRVTRARSRYALPTRRQAAA
jgi:hypothetical protein